MNRKQKFLVALPLLGSAAAVIFFRVAAVYPSSVSLYGYDFGFYAYAITHTPLNSIAYFFGSVSKYSNFLFVLINWIRLPQIPTLLVSFYVFEALGGVMMFLLLKKYGRLAAGLGVLLYCVSIPQTQLHLMFLWKAVFGQMWLLLSVYLLESKKWKSLAASSFALIITHITTGIIYLATLAVFMAGKIRNSKKLLLGGLTAVLGMALIILWRIGPGQITAFLHSPNYNSQQGDFLFMSEYLRYSWPILAAGIAGIIIYFKKPGERIWIILFAISLAWIAFNLPFHFRILQYFDLAILYFAVLGVVSIPKKNLRLIAAGVLLILSLGQFYLFKTSTSPQITPEQITEIKNFSIEHQGGFVLAISSQDGPWLLNNFYGNIRLAAPGLFEDNHSISEWQNYWQTQDSNFLKSFPKPLFIYQRSSVLIQNDDPCYKAISEHFYEARCN